MAVALCQAATLPPRPTPTAPAAPVTPDEVVLEVVSKDHVQAARPTFPKTLDVVDSKLEEENLDVARPRLLKPSSVTQLTACSLGGKLLLIISWLVSLRVVGAIQK